MPPSAIRVLTNRCLSVALAGLLVVTQTQAAEQAAPAQPGTQTPPPASPGGPAAPVALAAPLPVEQSLKILVLAGNNEQNDLERRVMAPLVVQVLDRDERPVETAEVVFRFPISGPGATFAGGKTALTVRTNTEGQAAALNWMANGQVGKFQVHVNASYGNQVGETTVSMSNVTTVVAEAHKSKSASWWSHTWVKIAVIGGAAAAIGIGVYLGTRGGSKSSGGTVTINPGSPTVGAP